MIKEIYSSVFDSHAMVDSPNLELNPSKIIKILAAERKARVSAIEDLLKNKSG
mgnify:FL=1